MSLEIIQRLNTDWTWDKISKDRLIRPLIFNGQGSYRKDMKTTQRVGSTRNFVKFKFIYGGAYDSHFLIEAGLIDLRLAWVTEAFPSPSLHHRNYFRVSGRGLRTVKLEVDDVEAFVSGDEDAVSFMQVMYPDVNLNSLALLSKFRYALNNVHQKLRERF